jgi:hypothetical protein
MEIKREFSRKDVMRRFSIKLNQNLWNNWGDEILKDEEVSGR